jgi:hypothetical protein
MSKPTDQNRDLSTSNDTEHRMIGKDRLDRHDQRSSRWILEMLALAFALLAAKETFGSPLPARADEGPVIQGTAAAADEYFGSMRMSIFGIRNKLSDLAVTVAGHPEQANACLGMAVRTEDAIRDWEAKYPHDSWIPKSIFTLYQVYALTQLPEGLNRAAAAAVWLRTKYADSTYATKLTDGTFATASGSAK